MSSAKLEEGQVFLLSAGDTVYAQVPRTLVFANSAGDWSLGRSEVKIDAGPFGYLAGNYVVTKTAMDGGGTGPNSYHGHHVWCQHLELGHEVDFYQSGSFTAMVKNAVVVGRAERSWNFQEVKS